MKKSVAKRKSDAEKPASRGLLTHSIQDLKKRSGEIQETLNAFNAFLDKLEMDSRSEMKGEVGGLLVAVSSIIKAQQSLNRKWLDLKRDEERARRAKAKAQAARN